jgi:hypothetical protein
MSLSPARLQSGLVSVKKGEASPTQPPPALDPVGPVTPSTSSPPAEQPQSPPSPPAPVAFQAFTAAPPPEPVRQAAPLAHPVRAQPKIVSRVSVSARLPPDMQEWIRVEAFNRHMPIQNLLEEIVAFYQINYPIWLAQQSSGSDS